ncbi:unnamed protein product, partial [Prorocentrum cordatum]
ADAALKAARQARNAAKPQLARHTTLGHKLQDAVKKKQKLQADVKSQQKVLAAAQEHLAELEAKVKSHDALIGTLQQELKETCPEVVKPEFKLPKLSEAILDANEEVRQMLASPVFAQATKLWEECQAAVSAAPAAAAPPQPAGAETVAPESARQQPGGAGGPAPAAPPGNQDEFMDVQEADVDELIAKAQQGDKRGLQAFLEEKGIRAKKPRCG